MKNIKNTNNPLPKVLGDTPNILILGTMPGRDSFDKKMYYANTRNIFWRLIYKIYNTDPDTMYTDKLNFLKNNNIALWDVCYSCYREGSLDSNIKNEIANDIVGLLQKHPSICKIVFNGKKAESLYKKHLFFLEGIDYHVLPSTSPANTRLTFEEKFVQWSKVIANSL